MANGDDILQDVQSLTDNRNEVLQDVQG